MFSWPAMTSYMVTSYDLYGGHRLAVALDSLTNRIWIVTFIIYHFIYYLSWFTFFRFIYFLSWIYRDFIYHLSRFIMDVENRLKRSAIVNICIKWFVTLPWEQCHSSATKGHRNLSLAELLLKGLRVSYTKNKIRLLSQKNVACSQEKLCVVWGDIPPGAGEG